MNTATADAKRDFQSAKSGESETAERGRQPKAAKDRTWLEFIAKCRLRKSRKLLISELYSILSNDRVVQEWNSVEEFKRENKPFKVEIVKAGSPRCEELMRYFRGEKRVNP